MKKFNVSVWLCAFVSIFLSTAANAEKVTNGLNQTVESVDAVRQDRSAPLPQLIEIVNQRNIDSPPALKPPGYTYPNFTQNPEKPRDLTLVGENNESRQTASRGAAPMPATIINVDGIGQADAPGGGLPPDTNGDVGLQYFVQYINTDWQIFDKATGAPVSAVFEGNTFWADFGGVCETNNSGDPIVLFDKLAERWIFSQFTSPSNPNGNQCFAISDRADLMDPAVTFFRYQFVFPGEFNDYPHIGIWSDASGDTSGYYFVTHDFQLPGLSPFNQASFSVVERDAMLVGGAAKFVRITNTGYAASSSFGALPAHLESDILPKAGMCAPFVHNRADLDAYLLWQLCVDWDSIGLSFLTSAIELAADSPFDDGVDNVPQPPPAPAGSELDNFAGNTMYRASVRAYPEASGVPAEMAINHETNAGDGVGGVRWVHLALPADVETPPPPGPDAVLADGFESPNTIALFNNPYIIQQGVYSPDDDWRWMGAISLDKSGSLGLAYSVSSTTTFPSVRYTGRTNNDPVNIMRDEQSCVVGAGVQQFVDGTGRAGRWGDYSSMSIDPVDQCTFWTSVEYYAVTGVANWENRICSFKFDDCGDPDFLLRSAAPKNLGVCTTGDDPTIDLNVYALNGYGGTVTLSGNGFEGGSGVGFSDNALNAFPASSTATLVNLDTAGTTTMSIEISGDDGGLARSLPFDLTISNGVPGVATLTTPSDDSTGQSVRPVLSWSAAADTLSYTVEVALDAGFTSIFEVGTTTETSYEVQGSLASLTEYFWRVTSDNNCGGGPTSATFSFTTGEPGACPSDTTPNIVFFDDIEGDVSDWTTPADPFGNGIPWATSGVRVNSGAASFLAVDTAVTSDLYLVSPSIVMPVGEAPITLSFWNYQNMEANTGAGTDACWDGGLLEVSTDGGANFVQLAGGRMLTDPYNGTITANAASPISQQEAWCADDIVPASGAPEAVSIVDINDLAGETVIFRFRLGTDGAAGDEGWYIDDVEVQSCTPDF